MRRLLVGLVLFLVFAGAMGQVTADPADQTAAVSSDYVLTETIDGIKIPYTVLLDVQMEYQGYAVVGVQMSSRSGQELYRLHIKTSELRSRENIYLLYDKEWEFIGDEKTLAPLQVTKPEPPTAPVVEKPQPPEDIDDEPEVEPEEPDDEEEPDPDEEPPEADELPRRGRN